MDPETARSPDDQLAPPTPTASRGPGPPGATRSVIEQAGAHARSVWSHRGVTSARARLVIVFGVLAIIVIRSTRPLNAFEILFGALGVGVLWWLLHLTGRRAQLSEPWASRLPGLLAAGAMVTAVLVGGRLAHRHVVYIGNTTFPTVPITPARSPIVPDVVGTSVDDARRLLTELGLVPIVKIANGTGGSDMIVSNLTPVPGTPVRPGSLDVVYAAPPSSFLPGTTIVTVPTTATNVQPSRSTTFITVPVIATTTPPSSESTAATSIATTVAPPSTLASSSPSTPPSTSTPWSQRASLSPTKAPVDRAPTSATGNGWSERAKTTASSSNCEMDPRWRGSDDSPSRPTR